VEIAMRHVLLLTLLMSVAIGQAPAKAADAANGAIVFKKCALCHVIEAGKKPGLGPNLSGVVGRKAATTTDFTYSTAMKASGLTWTPDKLDAYITKPSALVKGTKMVYSGLQNPKDRADLIAFLKSKK
jgi:cytochrome c